MTMRCIVFAVVCPAVLAVRLAKSDEVVTPQDLNLAIYASSQIAKPTENECLKKYTPPMCKDEEKKGYEKYSTATAVMSAYREDIHWLNEMPWSDNLTVFVHNRSSSRSHQTKAFVKEHIIVGEVSQRRVKDLNPRRSHPIQFKDIPNKGDEAAAYLTWIIENYDHLPDITFFIQAHRCSEHANFDMAKALPSIRECLDPNVGYFDINTYRHGAETKCKTTHELKEHPVTGLKIEKFEEIWTHLFAYEIGSMPVRICYDQYAQFAVSRRVILRHPLDFYKLLHKGVVKGKTTMEFFWRAVFEPSATSWQKLPPKDASGHFIRPERVLDPIEQMEISRPFDPSQHTGRYDS